MKMTKLSSVVLAAVVGLATLAQATNMADSMNKQARFKTGDVTLTVLDSSGVTPMKNAQIKMLSTEDGKELASAVADGAGRATIPLAVGRYLLNVAGRNLSVFEVADDATLDTFRVVVPDQALMVAGQEGEEEEEDDTIGAWVWVGGALVLLGAGYAIYEHNDDDGGDDQGQTADEQVQQQGGGDDQGSDGDDDDDSPYTDEQIKKYKEKLKKPVPVPGPPPSP